MIAASVPTQRPVCAKLLVVDSDGEIGHHARSRLPEFFRTGDLVIANDAATMPASLFGIHVGSGQPIEVRLATRSSILSNNVEYFTAVVFGEGDFRTPTERRPAPPPLANGDILQLGPLRATVVEIVGHPRFVSLHFEGSPRQIWEGLARHGRPIQYAHVPQRLAIWDTWTRIAGPPVAFEPPSAGFVLDWKLIQSLTSRGVSFGTITHAAGISSTGDPDLDALLPFDEPYSIPARTANLLRRARDGGGRVIAIGTSVVRALEHAAAADGSLRWGNGIAIQRIGPASSLRVVDALVSGTHEPGTSHHELLRAFISDEVLSRVDKELDQNGYRTHEFGDSVLIERSRLGPSTSIDASLLQRVSPLSCRMQT